MFFPSYARSQPCGPIVSAQIYRKNIYPSAQLNCQNTVLRGYNAPLYCGRNYRSSKRLLDLFLLHPPEDLCPRRNRTDWAELIEEGSEMTKEEWDELYGEEQTEDKQEATDEVLLEEEEEEEDPA